VGAEAACCCVDGGMHCPDAVCGGRCGGIIKLVENLFVPAGGTNSVSMCPQGLTRFERENVQPGTEGVSCRLNTAAAAQSARKVSTTLRVWDV
jgi:hypothetical protein